jgi:polar amino acid transport system ATP-binding protein
MRLELCDLEKWYGGQAALEGLTATIAHFKALAIIGPSGGGKTTLLRLIAGL